MNTNFKELFDEVGSVIHAIYYSKNYRSDKKKLWRIIEAWKLAFNSRIVEEDDLYTKCVLYAFEGAVNYHLNDLGIEDGMKFIENVLKTGREVTSDENFYC